MSPPVPDDADPLVNDKLPALLLPEDLPVPIHMLPVEPPELSPVLSIATPELPLGEFDV